MPQHQVEIIVANFGAIFSYFLNPSCNYFSKEWKLMTFSRYFRLVETDIKHISLLCSLSHSAAVDSSSIPECSQQAASPQATAPPAKDKLQFIANKWHKRNVQSRRCLILPVPPQGEMWMGKSFFWNKRQHTKINQRFHSYSQNQLLTSSTVSAPLC